MHRIPKQIVLSLCGPGKCSMLLRTKHGSTCLADCSMARQSVIDGQNKKGLTAIQLCFGPGDQRSVLRNWTRKIHDDFPEFSELEFVTRIPSTFDPPL